MRLLDVANIRAVGEMEPNDTEIETRVRELLELSYSLSLGDRARVYAALYDHLYMRFRHIEDVWADFFLDRIAADIELGPGPAGPEPRPAQAITIDGEEGGLPF